MLARDAFKIGFLERCAELGLDAEKTAEAAQRAEIFLKTGGLGGLVGSALNTAKSVGGTILGWGVPAAIATPLVGGGLAGYGLAKATDIDDTDVADIKDKEVIDEYKRQTALLQRQKAIRAYRAALTRGRKVA